MTPPPAQHPLHDVRMPGPTLVLVVDPKALLTNADFGTQSGAIGLSGDASSQANQPSSNLFDNLKGTGPYHFEWIPPSP